MWSRLINSLMLIALIAGLIVKVERAKNNRSRWKWIAGYIVCFIGLSYLSTYPLENLVYSFPSPEAVAQYACDGEVAIIVDGDESSLIVYWTKPGSYSYMISPKTESGYQIGRMLDHKETYQTASMQYAATIFSSEAVSDTYVVVSGLAMEECAAIQDSLNSAFTLYEAPEAEPFFEHEAVRILAGAYLGGSFDFPYEVSITDAESTATAEFP